MANVILPQSDSDTQENKPLDPHNAWIISPRGKRTSVNISPEAAVVWTRYGFKVEWFGSAFKAVA